MAVGEGQFQLYTRIPPDLEAGEWRIRADHTLDADGGTVGAVERSNVHFNINSPRYGLPPGQILSTYPPANSIGSYGSRLPQVVIKRRTLPWERLVDDDRPDTPWMALVLIAEGEAELRTGVAAAECFTDGVDLPGGDTLDDPEVGTGNCLVIRKSMVDRIFPTREEVDILAHAREVDINDTELALGDDDGFLSVVVSNRLPVPGVDEDGEDTPVRYLAALVNLEGQFDKLLPVSPAPAFITPLMFVESLSVATSTASDHAVMATAEPSARVAGTLGGATASIASAEIGGLRLSTLGGSVARSFDVTASALNANTSYGGGSAWSSLESVQAATQIYAEMAAGFSTLFSAGLAAVNLDEELRFPVLLSWSFTTSGETTFKSLMQGLDSRLMGDTSTTQAVPDGRLPLEVTETGHTGLVHRTREGDEVRSWYRGPLAPHPLDNAPAARIPLAHSSDQLRVVTPDRREDLSLAAAFEVGRLLALSRPAVIASLLRWRQDHFRAARLVAIREASGGLFESLGVLDELRGLNALLGDPWGVLVGRRIVGEMVIDPDQFLGQPRPLLTPGRSLDVAGVPSDVLATGLGLEASLLRGQPDVVFERLRESEVSVAEFDIEKIGSEELFGGLQTPLGISVRDLGTDALAEGLVFDSATGPAFGAIGVPELIDVELEDHFGSVLSGKFSAKDAIDDGTIGEVPFDEGGVIVGGGPVDEGGLPLDGPVDEGGLPLVGPFVDEGGLPLEEGELIFDRDGIVVGAADGFGGMVPVTTRSLGRPERGGLPLARPAPLDLTDDNERVDQ